MVGAKLRPALGLAAGVLIWTAAPAAAAGNLTLPFADPHPRITSWMDHHYPTRDQDGIMIRFDGLTGFPYDGHKGTDFAIPSNTPVVAADEGTVIYADWSDTGGWGIAIDHVYDRTAYFHNNKLFVYEGQHVSRGQLIALSGSTGNSTGPHLHFEVRDLLVPWHAVDPYGWTGPGQDPWRWDMGYLWTSAPPVPFVLPLAFFGGAAWNHWYGHDGAPPAINWQIRDGGRGLSGYAAQWDTDPGPGAARTRGIAGSAVLPGPGAHTLHLRVFDGAGQSADISYLYLYDVDPPTAHLSLGSGSTAVPVQWRGNDALSGVKEVVLEVASGTEAQFRPWLRQTIENAVAGNAKGAVRFFGEPGKDYRFRLTLLDQARNASEPDVATVSLTGSIPGLVSAADQGVLGPLPSQPGGAPAALGVAAEHPIDGGSVLLAAEGTLHGLGKGRLSAAAPGSPSSAVDVVSLPGGMLRLLRDGSSWDLEGKAGPRFSLPNPVRLLSTAEGTLLAFDAQGSIAGPAGLTLSPPLDPNYRVVDSGLFSSGLSGLVLDSGGNFHAFGGADRALVALPTKWTLPGDPAGLLVAGTPDAPAGLLIDSTGRRQAYGSLLLLPQAAFSGPTFDPLTGLPLR
jgi:murein DD-endopeptidase MepM/ murein hydrolase activator NlpD